MNKKWYQSKTIWAGIAEIFVGVTQVVAESPIVGDDVTGAAVTVAGVATILLRFLTSGPIK